MRRSTFPNCMKFDYFAAFEDMKLRNGRAGGMVFFECIYGKRAAAAAAAATVSGANLKKRWKKRGLMWDERKKEKNMKENVSTASSLCFPALVDGL